MLLYVHVPFCQTRCRYCAFFSRGLGKRAIPADYADTILAEARYWEARLREDGHSTQVETVFFGGGTPSLLEPAVLGKLLDGLAQTFSFDAQAEISLEANPCSIQSPATAQAIRDAGFTRISIGVQSMNDTELRQLGRLHSASQAKQALHNAHAAGFSSIGADLIWGLPDQTPESWRTTLQDLLACAPDHVSAYSLTIEPGTPFARAFDQGKLHLPDEDAERRMYLEGSALLEKNGILQYEISNYARPGHDCRHNEGYWEGKDYLGLGPSAVSTIRNRRWTDTPDIRQWKNDVETGTLGGNPELLGPREHIEELMMLHLRTVEGLPIRLLQDALGFNPLPNLQPFLQALKQAGLIRWTTHQTETTRQTGTGETPVLHLTREGMLVSNAVLSELLERVTRLL